MPGLVAYCAGMRTLLSVAVAVTVGATGCSNDTVKRVEEMADRACACPDADCAGQVEKEFWAFAKEAGQKRGTKDDRDQVQQHYNRMRECIVKTRSAPPAGDPRGAGAEGAATGAAGAAGSDAPRAEAGK